MSRSFAIGFVATVAVIVAVLFSLHNSQKGNVLEPSGKIWQVRTAALDGQNSVLLIDFSVTNPSDRNMVIRYINVTVHDAKGVASETTQIAASDLPVLFRYHKELGVLERAPLVERDVVDPHRTATGITGVRVALPLSDLQARRDVQLEVEDVSGPKVVLTAK